jgi:hypothetical protein
MEIAWPVRSKKPLAEPDYLINYFPCPITNSQLLSLPTSRAA